MSALEDAAAFWYEGKNGARLRAAIYWPAGRARGGVVLSPGRTEFIEKYRPVVDELLSRGFAVVTHDWRGQGLSDRMLPAEPLKGHATTSELFLQDYALLLAQAERRGLPRPWIGMGHSMGGALTLLAHLDRLGDFAAVVLSAPMLGVKLSMPAWFAGAMADTRCLLGQAEAYARGASDPWAETFADNEVTHDEVCWRRTHDMLMAHRELALGSPTWGWVRFALKSSAEIRRRAHELKGRPAELRIVAAGDDRLADTEAARQVARAADTLDQFTIVEHAFHEVLMETSTRRGVFWREFEVLAARLTT
ncbi:MAG: alpha/beta hydrolase [Phenylobacterium sp.]|uniref:alpha/beta fold hydrolase n=1 Tax=Phenylobacterium sp. TaxID=1871053 RepID=UPI0025F7EDB5|nr:alpha/beta hydrolase [Phenylobacterium sp.]MBA4010944.1 alpha/beta hydrolase [Phenylobacterium sp.]